MTLISLPGPPAKCHICGAPTVPVNATTIKCTGTNCDVVYKKRKTTVELHEPGTSTDIQAALALLKQQFGEALAFKVPDDPLVGRMVFVLLGQGISMAKVIIEGSKTLWILGPNNQKIQRRRRDVLAVLKPGYGIELQEQQRPPADEGLNPMPCAETEFVPPKEKP